ncbi:hypothetical protein ZHAS_00019917 [Anopheles sinensis]|uniref:Uncharacterized protein n=1 Tax=Anopheles sinensis TaxID=74873 RepID=A0A084WMJ3_ANOSI|nr:hypothetical protein ZHAS_00019917 [Anopheles sinensis]
MMRPDTTELRKKKNAPAREDPEKRLGGNCRIIAEMSVEGRKYPTEGHGRVLIRYISG